MSLAKLIKTDIESIKAFRQKLEQSNKKIDIEQSINTFINNYYDLIYNYENVLFYYRYYCDRYRYDYNHDNCSLDNYPCQMFKRINRLKKRVIAYNKTVHSQNQPIDTNNDFIFDQNSIALNTDTYELLLEDYIDSIDLFLNSIDTMNRIIDLYTPSYLFIHRDLGPISNNMLTFFKSLLDNIIPCNEKEYNNLLAIESTSSHIIDLSRIIDNSYINMYYKHLIVIASEQVKSSDLYDKYIVGSIDQCKISNNAFNIIICNALNCLELNNDKTVSYQLLINSLKYLSPNGVLCYLTFDFCLTKSTCSILAKYLTDVKIKYDTKTHSVCIVGIRRKDKIPDQELYNRLRHLLIARQDIENNIDNNIYLTKPLNELKTFIGSELNSQMLQSFIDKHDIFQDMHNAQNAQIDIQNNKRPLLPFSIGQLGLVLTSGCLNGVIEETNSNGEIIGAHAIKGIVTKETSKSTSVNENRYRIEENITNNKVHINVFKPNGDLVTLA